MMRAVFYPPLWRLLSTVQRLAGLRGGLRFRTRRLVPALAVPMVVPRGMAIMMPTNVAILLASMFVLPGCNRLEIELDPRAADFTKLDAAGQAMAPNAGPWACVADRATGLVWENKSGDEGLHHGAWTYTWRDPSWPVQAQGTCAAGVFASCDTAELVRAANVEGRCGFTDWRLPTEAELRTLIDTRVPHPGPQIHDCWFPFTERGSYWTAERGIPAGRQRGVAFQALDFARGEHRALLFNRAAYVRLVRGPVWRSSIERGDKTIGGDLTPGEPVP